MYINAAGHYIPKQRISNEYFNNINGLSSEWIYQRTGIKSRSKASDRESINFMCEEAVKDAKSRLQYPIEDVDLIIFASYTPSDTVGTIGHHIQKLYGIKNAKVFYISSACSSAINAMEIIKAFFKTDIASKALMICADRNSTYSDEADCVSGHLWGDAATAFFFSAQAYSTQDVRVLDVISQGLGHIGNGPEGVVNDLIKGGLQMPFGRDVFMHACSYISKNVKDILIKNDFEVKDLNYFIGHQANMRIIKNVAKQLDISDDKILSNIEELGNTGSTSAPLVLSQNMDKIAPKSLVCMSVFGGGYSAGACLIQFP